jgi:hypothetical protein
LIPEFLMDLPSFAGGKVYEEKDETGDFPSICPETALAERDENIRTVPTCEEEWTMW